MTDREMLEWLAAHAHRLLLQEAGLAHKTEWDGTLASINIDSAEFHMGGSAAMDIIWNTINHYIKTGKAELQQ